jgi:sorting nexin-4
LLYTTMLGEDEDVFDSVTWETETAAPAYEAEERTPSGPGFRQSTSDNEGGPHDPKWEGYLITNVKDPVKELAETKDAYVSYLVSAKVRWLGCSHCTILRVNLLATA